MSKEINAPKGKFEKISYHVFLSEEEKPLQIAICIKNQILSDFMIKAKINGKWKNINSDILEKTKQTVLLFKTMPGKNLFTFPDGGIILAGFELTITGSVQLIFNQKVFVEKVKLFELLQKAKVVQKVKVDQQNNLLASILLEFLLPNDDHVINGLLEKNKNEKNPVEIIKETRAYFKKQNINSKFFITDGCAVFWAKQPIQ